MRRKATLFASLVVLLCALCAAQATVYSVGRGKSFYMSGSTVGVKANISTPPALTVSSGAYSCAFAGVFSGYANEWARCGIIKLPNDNYVHPFYEWADGGTPTRVVATGINVTAGSHWYKCVQDPDSGVWAFYCQDMSDPNASVYLGSSETETTWTGYPVHFLGQVSPSQSVPLMGTSGQKVQFDTFSRAGWDGYTVTWTSIFPDSGMVNEGSGMDWQMDVTWGTSFRMWDNNP